jgi:pimeloyl-ACP methyl ester carboxylesterase
MSKVISRDGTAIAYDRIGNGPAVILVNGALVYRAFQGRGPLATLLADHFTVYTYDRRGRGESGDTLPYAVEREVEDLDALINEAGSTACVYGDSSGAALVMEAALRLGDKIQKIAMYEVPYNDDATARKAWRKYTNQLVELLAANRPGDAVELFMTTIVGAPAEVVNGMRQSHVWQILEAIAPTLAYDHTAILGDEASIPTDRAARVTVPALVMNGSMSFPFMRDTARALSKAIPLGQHMTIEGASHDVSAEALAPVLKMFFADTASGKPTDRVSYRPTNHTHEKD